MLDTKWHEPKTIESYTMQHIRYKRSWFGFHFMMGAYAMYSNGIFCDYDQIKAELEYVVFPRLQKISDSCVERMLSKYIRKFLISHMRNGVLKVNKNIPLSLDQKAHIE